MKIEQFADKGLSHYAYAVLSECEKKVVFIDPARDIAPYLAFAEQHEAQIIGIIETHPHADFVSGHLELYQVTGATVYCSALVGAAYPHQSFDDGQVISYGKIKLKAWNTPGHSPDSISVVLEYGGEDKAVFTGDTLFVGDCGRPDLRETAGHRNAGREELASQMYHSLRGQLMTLDNNVLVYPAHGAGTLCGKALSEANHSTIGAEKISNWSLQEMSEQEFVKRLTADQPFVPRYFPYDVKVNKEGAEPLTIAIASVALGRPITDVSDLDQLDKKVVIIDARPSGQYKKAHLSNSVNLQDGGKFETWLGSIIAPGEPFYLFAKEEADLQDLIRHTAKIGYESFIKEARVLSYGNLAGDNFDPEFFQAHLEDFTIVDVRNSAEHQEHPIFKGALNIPLPELRERVGEIPLNKPIAVHCAGGYRSAAGSSIIADLIRQQQVYDMNDSIKEFNSKT